MRQGLRQVDVAARAGISQQVVSEIERGHFDEEKVSTVDRIGLALGIPLTIVPLFDRADMDRVLDARHAEVVEAFIARLAAEWQTHPEESFNVFGERGDADLAAWHEVRAALAIAEIKTELTDIGEALRTLSRKARLLPRVVLERYGWQAKRVGVFLVMLDTSANRRLVRKYTETFDASLPMRGKSVAAWFADPTEDAAGIMFLSPTPTRCTKRRRQGGRDGSGDSRGGAGP